MQTWKAGIAKAIITPEKPLWLSGYGGIRQAEGKRHDLWGKALVLEAEEGKCALLLTSDLLGLSKPMIDRLCAALQLRFGLERSQVMLTYSHNHCAPVTSETLRLATCSRRDGVVLGRLWWRSKPFAPPFRRLMREVQKDACRGRHCRPDQTDAPHLCAALHGIYNRDIALRAQSDTPGFGSGRTFR